MRRKAGGAHEAAPTVADRFPAKSARRNGNRPGNPLAPNARKNAPLPQNQVITATMPTNREDLATS